MKYFKFVTLISILASCSLPDNTPKAIAESAALSEKVEVCIACHGLEENSGKEGVPPLKGRTYEELKAAMERLREYYSPQPLLAHNFSDNDIHDIAIYFSETDTN